MSNFDVGFALVSLVLAIVLIAWSPLYRAIVFECLFHPRSEGWIAHDEDGSVHAYRDEALPDSSRNGATKAREAAPQSVEDVEGKDKQAELG